MKEMPVTDTLFGPAMVRRDGRMVHDMYLVEVKKPGESGSDWDSYKVLRNVPGMRHSDRCRRAARLCPKANDHREARPCRASETYGYDAAPFS
jgi:hypothetical protein